MLPLAAVLLVALFCDGAHVQFIRPAEGDVTFQLAPVVEFEVHKPHQSSRVILQLDGGDQGILCEKQRMTVTLEDLSTGKHTVSVTIDGFPPAVLTFWHKTKPGHKGGRELTARRGVFYDETAAGSGSFDVNLDGQHTFENINGGFPEPRLRQLPVSTPQRPLLTIKVLTMNRNASLLRLLVRVSMST
jgi:hypothetical protein